MYSTTVNYYIQRQQVLLYSGTSNRRYDIVYAKNLTLTKGVDNKIQFEFLNQDQKPIDITGKVISFRLINSDSSIVYFRKQLTPTLALKGLAELELDSSDLLPVDPQQCFYSLEMGEGSSSYPVFVSPDSMAKGIVNVVDTIYAKHRPSIGITIPSHPVPLPTGITFYSSAFNTLDQTLFSDQFTIQMKLDQFTGNVVVQGSTSQSSFWYNIISTNTDTAVNSYEDSSDTISFRIEGYHPWIRVEFNDVSSGTVANLLIR